MMIERSYLKQMVGAWAVVGAFASAALLLLASFFQPLTANLAELGQLTSSQVRAVSAMADLKAGIAATPTGARFSGGLGFPTIDELEDNMVEFVRVQSEAGLDIRVEPARQIQLSERLTLLSFETTIGGTRDDIGRFLAAVDEAAYGAESFSIRANNPTGQQLVMKARLIAIGARS